VIFESSGSAELSPLDAERVWRALTTGQATLLRHHDEDEERHLVIGPERASSGALSPIEARVLSRAAAGERFKLLAFDLDLRVSTVAHHLDSALRKTGFRSRIELCRLAGPKGERGIESEGAGLPPPLGLEGDVIENDEGALSFLRFPLARGAFPEGLTPAERVVVQRVLEGSSNASIARERRTTLSTVASQLRALYRKVGVSSRAELAGLCNRLSATSLETVLQEMRRKQRALARHGNDANRG
jgi:DNA-binding NarL/FixJ family response regulator